MNRRELFQLNGYNPHTMTFVYESDIYNMCKLGWYKWWHYFDDSRVSMLPFQKECLGHVLVPANSEGNEITQWILKDNGKIVPRRTENNLTA